MLKPSSTTIMDQEYVEYYPHLVFLHNKAELQDFKPDTIDKVKVPIFYLNPPVNLIFYVILSPLLTTY